MTREEAVEVYHGLINEKIKEAFEFFAPELAESEDERIRKWIIEKVQGYADSGIPCSDEIQMANKALAYLEKQKEQKPMEPSDEELQRHQDELYDFKVFAARQAREHHISFVHDFEWNNFCAEILSYFNE